MKGKTKDNVQTRLDLEAMNIRPELHPIRNGDKIELPVACYTLSNEEKHLFCLFYKYLRVPDGFSSNISQSVNMKEHKISGLKSHDHHVLLQHLLPLGIRGLLPKEVCEPLIELSLFFTSLGAKTLRVDELENIEAQIPITLCKLEQVFPPSFFDVMVHLSVHLANEAKIAGPVQYRWMYPIERMLHGLKRLIRNMARPEGSIAEGYIARECMIFCSMYLKDAKTKFNPMYLKDAKTKFNSRERNSDGGLYEYEGEISMFSQLGRSLGAGTSCILSDDDRMTAHIYILKNCDEVQPFLEEYNKIQQKDTEQKSEEERTRNFVHWCKEKVEKMKMQGQNTKFIDELVSLSRGPSQYATSFNGYVVNGYRFRVEDRDNKCRTQNSGVCVVGDIGNEENYVDYYGVLKQVLELQYLDGKRVVLFRCRWFDVYDNEKGVKIDEHGFVSINCHRLLKTNEPFILANQASQVFYTIDNVNKGWHIAVKTQARDSYDMPQPEEDDENDACDLGEAYQHSGSFKFDSGGSTSFSSDDKNIWSRTHLDSIVVEMPTSIKKRKRKST